MSFEADLIHRTATVYADFLLPHLRRDARLLDCGCGSGSITLGLRDFVGSIAAVDLDAAVMQPAERHARAEAIANVHFLAADATALPFPDSSFDGVYCHSMLEAAKQPEAVVREAARVLVAGGVIGAASVEYGGLILSGPESERLHEFYRVRERLWELDGVARPRAGRDLRRLLSGAGFVDVRASAHYLSYGTPDAVRFFGEGRARDCLDEWFSSRTIAHGLYSQAELRQTESAWRRWSASPDSFAAFAWCRATARKKS